MTPVRSLFPLLLLTALALPARAADNTAPLKLKDGDFPTQVQPQVPQLTVFNTQDWEFPSNCRQLRIARVNEFALPWRPYIAHLSLDACHTETVGTDNTPETSYKASATLTPGRVTYRGIPVSEVREENAELYGSRMLVLAAPLKQVLAKVRPDAERDCAAAVRRNPSIHSDCRMERDDEGNWGMTIGELNSRITLSPDPANPALTLYTISGGD